MGKTVDQALSFKILKPDNLAACLTDFLLDAESRNLSKNTIRIYKQHLTPFLDYLREKGIVDVQDIKSTHVRAFLVYLIEQGHNPGGSHIYFRVAKTFSNFLRNEELIDKDLFKNIKPPKLSDEPLEPLMLDDLKALLSTCNSKSVIDIRDRALLMFLPDSGLRASELIALNIGDVNLPDGSVQVRMGKGHKFRVVFIGKQTRRAIATYLRLRGDTQFKDPLWLTCPLEQTYVEPNRLTYWGLRQILRRRAEESGIKVPALHSFRRFFALSALRAGMDLISLQRLLGHADLSVLKRYLRQETSDLSAAHRQASPMDRLL